MQPHTHDETTLQNNVLPLIILNNSDNNICIPKDIAFGHIRRISNDGYSINEIIITAKCHGIKIMTS